MSRRPAGKRQRAGATLAERRQAIFGARGIGQIIEKPPAQTARHIWDYLVREGVVSVRGGPTD